MKRSANTHCPFSSAGGSFADMVGAGGGEQQRFGLRAPAVLASAEQQFADLLGAFATARFAGHDHVEPALAQGRGERRTCVDLPTPSPPSRLMNFRGRHAIPNSDLSSSQIRPKNPALPTSSPATSGTTCGGVSPVVTTSWATSCPLAIGADERPL